MAMEVVVVVYKVVYISISISLSSIGQTRMETSQESELEQVTHFLTMLASSSGTPMMSCVDSQSASMSWGFLGASACSQNKLEERSSMQGFKLEQVFTFIIDFGFILCIFIEVLIRITICKMFLSITLLAMCLEKIIES